jgi:type I restriction enzyme, S subunit
LIPRKGSIKNIFYVNEPFWTVDTIFYTKIDKGKIIPKYLYYYLSNQNLEELNVAGGVPSLTKSVLDKVEIVLPNLEVQQKIVGFLDNFSTIIDSFDNGLPAEISARRKQYEYYRNKLLTFKEVANDSV